MTGKKDNNDNKHTDHEGGGNNGLIAIICVFVVAGMVGLSFAAVPLYSIFCQVTGFAGTTRVAQRGADKVTNQQVTVRFDSNVAGGLNWTFRPEQVAIGLKAGETKLALFEAINHGGKITTGSATFNVTPEWAGQYFNKIQCFCFTEQTLQPGERVDMPVAFFVDPKIAEERSSSRALTITLSYTFYPVEEPEKPVADASARGSRIQ